MFWKDDKYIVATLLEALVLKALLASSFTRGQRAVTCCSCTRQFASGCQQYMPFFCLCNIWKAADKMPQTTNGGAGAPKVSKAERARRYLAGAAVAREDSDDELGLDDHPWVWLYERSQPAHESERDGESSGSDSVSADESDGMHSRRPSRKRRRVAAGRPKTERIIGARMGCFECGLGDCVLLKAEGTNEAWVGIICEFTDDEEHGMAARFMWFSSEKEIRNKEKKRKDFMLV